MTKVTAKINKGEYLYRITGTGIVSGIDTRFGEGGFLFPDLSPGNDSNARGIVGPIRFPLQKISESGIVNFQLFYPDFIYGPFQMVYFIVVNSGLCVLK